MLRLLFAAVSVWIITIPPQGAFAHGTDYRFVDKKAVVMEFFYSDKKPMQYSEVLIFSPENDTIEYQNGRTDQNGCFAFLPELTGEWRVQVSDGVGHAVSAAVAVNLENTGSGRADSTGDIPQKQPAMLDGVPKMIKVVFGISLLANIFLGIAVWKRNSAGGAPLKE